jgi:branched-subunit amino acid ABC-type transport system permease component
MLVLELAINGLVQGSLLALICIGYSLAYGSAKVVNFAHADVMIAGGGYLVLLWVRGGGAEGLGSLLMPLLLGAAVAFGARLWLPERRFPGGKGRLAALALGVAAALATSSLAGRLPFWIAALLAIPATAALAAAVYRIGYLPLLRREAPRTSVLLAALGMSIALESFLLVSWGSVRRVFPEAVLPQALVVRPVPADVTFWQAAVGYGVIELGRGLRLPVHDALIVLIFAIVMAALAIFFHTSRAADAIVATADSRLAARSCGIPVERVLGHAFLIGGAVASLGGTLYVLRAKSLDPAAGFSPGVLAFAACVLGGIGSLRGSVIGAFLASMVISLAPAVPVQDWVARFAPSAWLPWLPSTNLGDWSYGAIYAFMIVAILFKPEGLFAR